MKDTSMEQTSSGSDSDQGRLFHGRRAGPGHGRGRRRRLWGTYWQENLRLVAVCLVVWFFVSFGCGLLLADVLNEVTFGGFHLGFWFAQQGSIYVFVPLIFIYAWRVTRLDRKYGTDESDERDATRDD